MAESQLSETLKQAILDLAAQPDIHSISCPFTDFDLWSGLLAEQIKQSRLTGKPPQEALCLLGPDSGVPGITNRWIEDVETPLPPIPDPISGRILFNLGGGQIHTPYESACGADLFIVPDWHGFSRAQLALPNARLHLAVMKPCNYLLIRYDVGEFECATRTRIENWFLYKSKAPYMDCNPFHDQFD